jgi:hypothetical protein
MPGCDIFPNANRLNLHILKRDIVKPVFDIPDDPFVCLRLLDVVKRYQHERLSERASAIQPEVFKIVRVNEYV